MKIRQVEAYVLHEDGHDEANASKNGRSLQLPTAYSLQLTLIYDPFTSTANSVTANMTPPNLPCK